MTPIVVVDAFSDRPFAGNPAAVCLLPGPADEGWMQAVAAEFNLSETAFLYRIADGYSLRWFTPASEVDLCGHATLASAHVLFEDGQVNRDAEARFHTSSGLLTCRLAGDGHIEMDFPCDPCVAAEAPAGLIEALGVSPLFVGKDSFDYLVEVAGEAEVRGLRPDMVRLAAVRARGVIVTAPASTPGFDFVSRFFAPAAGIPEDPVTGSAHCCLGPYWGERLGKRELTAFQASKRGGTVHLRLQGERVVLSGDAVTVWRGELLHPPPSPVEE